jgi:hypothetical protein
MPIRYFETLPKLIVTDVNKNSKVFTNLLARASIIQNLLIDPLFCYNYDVKDSDTPETIAHKYYDTVDRFWLVMFANQIIDPLWDWPLDTYDFNKYVNAKYGSTEISEIHHYEKIVTKTDISSNTTTVEKFVIDKDTYDNLIESTDYYEFESGEVSVIVTKKAIDNFEYELNLNESKRTIKLINKIYAGQIESELVKIMRI